MKREKLKENQEQISAFVDGELDEADRESMEQLLEEEQALRSMQQWTVALKQRIKQADPAPGKAPGHLRARITMALDQEDEKSAGSLVNWKSWLSWAPAGAIVVASLLIVGLTFFGNPGADGVNFTDITLEAYHRLARSELHLSQPGDPVFEQKVQQAGIPASLIFPSLAGMNYENKGCCFGLQAEGRPVAHYLFRNDEGHEVSMILWHSDSEKNVIEGTKVEHNGKEYVLAKRQGIEMVLWKDGEIYSSIFCDKVPREKLLAMASQVRS